VRVSVSGCAVAIYQSVKLPIGEMNSAAVEMLERGDGAANADQ